MQKASAAVGADFLMAQMRVQKLVRGRLRPCLCMQLRSVEFNDSEALGWALREGRREESPLIYGCIIKALGKWLEC